MEMPSKQQVGKGHTVERTALQRHPVRTYERETGVVVTLYGWGNFHASHMPASGRIEVYDQS